MHKHHVDVYDYLLITVMPLLSAARLPPQGCAQKHQHQFSNSSTILFLSSTEGYPT
jgi:hypothetical protein